MAVKFCLSLHGRLWTRPYGTVLLLLDMREVDGVDHAVLYSREFRAGVDDPKMKVPTSRRGRRPSEREVPFGDRQAGNPTRHLAADGDQITLDGCGYLVELTGSRLYPVALTPVGPDRGGGLPRWAGA